MISFLKAPLSLSVLLGIGVVAGATTSAQAATLDEVKAKGFLQCGIDGGLPGFGMINQDGSFEGLDVDTCRAVAAAVLGDADALKVTPLTAKERFTALASGEVDVLARNSTWTATRDTSLGVSFAGVNYYDGQGFMVPKSLGVSSALELDGASVCIQAGTTTELNLADYFKANDMTYESITFETSQQTADGMSGGRCDLLTSDTSQLAAIRSKFSNGDDFEVLPEIISKEPLGPVVAAGDERWFKIVRWVLIAQINAEELGITSANADEMKNSKNANIQRLLGMSGAYGDMLGIPNDFAYQAIKQVGNYQEMFERNVGPNTPIGLPRGVNALWSDGGILYAPPFR